MPFSPPPSEPDIDADVQEIAALKWLNPGFLERNLAVPVGLSDGQLVLGMANPDDQSTIDALHFASGRKVLPVAMDAAEICGLLAIPVGDAAAALGRGANTNSTRPHLRIEEAGCTAFLGNGAEIRVASDEDQAAWRAITPALKKHQLVDVAVPKWATMQIDLPGFPQNARQLREQLIRLAPVMPSQLAWTQPQIGEGGAASVTVVRRAWLGERLGAIERASGLTLRAVAADGHLPLQFSSPRTRLRNRLKTGALAAALVAVLAGSWMIGRPNSAGISRSAVANSQTSGPKAESPIVRPPPLASAPAQSAGGPAPPSIVGIVGRLPDGAEVLVRIAPGRTSSVKIGEEALGWKLIGVAADRAVFEMAGLRREVVLKPVQ